MCVCGATYIRLRHHLKRRGSKRLAEGAVAVLVSGDDDGQHGAGVFAGVGSAAVGDAACKGKGAMHAGKWLRGAEFGVALARVIGKREKGGVVAAVRVCVGVDVLRARAGRHREDGRVEADSLGGNTSVVQGLQYGGFVAEDDVEGPLAHGKIGTYKHGVALAP